jgi:hypothetical protein
LRRTWDDIRYGDWSGFAFFSLGGIALFIFGIVITVPLCLIGALIGGWTLSTLWVWFVVPAFGLHVLTFWHATGIALIIRFPVTYTLGFNKSRRDMVSGAFITVFAPFIPLFTGWIIHTWLT